MRVQDEITLDHVINNDVSVEAAGPRVQSNVSRSLCHRLCKHYIGKTGKDVSLAITEKYAELCDSVL